MDFEARAIGGSDPLLGVRRSGRSRPAQAHPAGGLPAVRVTLSQGPPPDASAAVARAAARVEDLEREGRELRFELDEETGRMRAEIRDLDGKVLRTMPLREALEIAGGAPVE